MGEGFRFRPPESKRSKPIVLDMEKGPEPEDKLGPEKASTAAPLEPQIEKAKTYDRSYWTPERISQNVASFFEKLERNEQRMRAERQRLLEQAVKQETERKAAEKVIVEREMAEAEEQRRKGFRREIEETETQRQFRLTIEWMVEQSHEQIRELAINFLQNAGVQDQAQDEDK